MIAYAMIEAKLKKEGREAINKKAQTKFIEVKHLEIENLLRTWSFQNLEHWSSMVRHVKRTKSA